MLPRLLEVRQAYFHLVIIEVHLVLLVELLVLVEPLDYRLDYNHREERQGALGAESDHFCATLKVKGLNLLVSLS